jgi:hypothetical protein
MTDLRDTSSRRLDKPAILGAIYSHLDELRDIGVSRIGLFGSYVRDEQSSESDVDLLVEFRTGEKNFDRFMGLADSLETWLDNRVELLTPESLSPYIGPHILREIEYVEVGP